MKTFKRYCRDTNIIEGFDRTAAVKDALVWLEGRFGTDIYIFKDTEDMEMSGSNTKVYDINVDGRTYILNLRKFDCGADEGRDVLKFDIKPDILEVSDGS